MNFVFLEEAVVAVVVVVCVVDFALVVIFFVVVDIVEGFLVEAIVDFSSSAVKPINKSSISSGSSVLTVNKSEAVTISGVSVVFLLKFKITSGLKTCGDVFGEDVGTVEVVFFNVDVTYRVGCVRVVGFNVVVVRV